MPHGPGHGSTGSASAPGSSTVVPLSASSSSQGRRILQIPSVEIQKRPPKASLHDLV
jgi:hypothetical protein